MSNDEAQKYYIIPTPFGLCKSMTLLMGIPVIYAPILPGMSDVGCFIDNISTFSTDGVKESLTLVDQVRQ